eukprot:maker-scaffold_12-snap-gene-4.41-mRNA-1 protein AED:0.09 eAED:0.09 QI:109/1/1/1/1/1/3/306/474
MTTLNTTANVYLAYIMQQMTKPIRRQGTLISFLPFCFAQQFLPHILFWQGFQLLKTLKKLFQDAGTLSFMEGIAFIARIYILKHVVHLFNSSLKVGQMFKDVADGNRAFQGTDSIGEMGLKRWFEHLFFSGHFAKNFLKHRKFTNIDYRADVGFSPGHVPNKSVLGLILDIIRINSAQSNTHLDIFYSSAAINQLKSSKERIKCVFYVHGGAFTIGNKTMCTRLVMDLIEQGYFVFSINYRLAPDHRLDIQLEDVNCGLRWADKYAYTYLCERNGVVPELIQPKMEMLIVGESAGGYHALMPTLGYHFDEEPEYKIPEHLTSAGPKIVGCIDIYGVKDLADENEFVSRIDPAGAYRALINRVSPLTLAKLSEGLKTISPYSILKLIAENETTANGVPPIITFHGTHDSLVNYDTSVEFHKVLKELRKKNSQKVIVPDMLFTIPYGRHAFNLLTTSMSFSVSDVSLKFAEKCFKN